MKHCDSASFTEMPSTSTDSKPPGISPTAKDTMTKPRRTPVFAVEDLPDGTMRRATIGRRTLLVIRRGDDIFAVRDVCPHQGAPLSAGILSCARKETAVGCYETDEPRVIVRCPWHNWEIDVTCGVARHDPNRTVVATYTAGIEHGKIFIEC